MWGTRSEQQRGEPLTLSQHSRVRHEAATETGWEKKKKKAEFVVRSEC